MLAWMSGRCVVSVLSELRSQLLAVVEPLDVDTLAPEVALAAVREITQLERLTAAAKVLVLRRVVETEAWRGEARSAADWLARTAGISYGQARALVETAEAVGKNEDVEVAVRSGVLSEAQVREIAPAAVAAPDK